MSFLYVEDLHINLGDFSLQGVSLSVEQGDYLTVMGPTGAGKTILLECIIGFYKPERGRIFIDGVDITDERPENRRMGIVYQDYALMPHMTVFKNIEYGLKKTDKDKDSRKHKILAMAESLNIGHILHRRPATLSGGEQQRVALARAFVVEPRLLLMDEPLSALDPQTRNSTRALLRKAVGDYGVTVLHITHDMDDVWALANKVAILKDGRVAQQGTLDGIFNRPCSRFIADFVGAAIFEGKVAGANNGHCKVDIQGLTLASSDKAEPGDKVRVALRPENVMVFRERPRNLSARNVIEATLDECYRKGTIYHLNFRAGGVCIPALMTTNAFKEMRLEQNGLSFLAIKSSNVRII